MEEALERAKRAANGSSGLSRAIGGISPQAVSQWKRVPLKRVLDVERATGVSRYELRPDFFGVEAEDRSSAAIRHEKTAASVSRRAAL